MSDLNDTPAKPVKPTPTAPVQATEETLDTEFLDYLATFEGDREDWTFFSDKDGDEETADDKKKETETQ